MFFAPGDIPDSTLRDTPLEGPPVALLAPLWSTLKRLTFSFPSKALTDRDGLSPVAVS